MKNFFQFILRFYQLAFSGILSVLFGPGCRFSPTCSVYARQAIARHGVYAGSLLALKRLARCHPYGSFGPDPVPESL